MLEREDDRWRMSDEQHLDKGPIFIDFAMVVPVPVVEKHTGQDAQGRLRRDRIEHARHSETWGMTNVTVLNERLVRSRLK